MLRAYVINNFSLLQVALAAIPPFDQAVSILRNVHSVFILLHFAFSGTYNLSDMVGES